MLGFIVNEMWKICGLLFAILNTEMYQQRKSTDAYKKHYRQILSKILLDYNTKARNYV